MRDTSTSGYERRTCIRPILLLKTTTKVGLKKKKKVFEGISEKQIQPELEESIFREQRSPLRC